MDRQNDELLKRRKESEAILNRYENLYHKYSVLFDFAPLGFVTLDRDGYLREINMEAAMALDTPRGALVGRRITEFIHPEDQDAFYYQKLICKEKPDGSSFELRMRTVEDKFFDAQLHMLPLPESCDPVSAFLLSVSNLKNRRHLSTSLSMIGKWLETTLKVTDPDTLQRTCVQQLSAYLQCDGVGIGWLQGAGSAPRWTQEGFEQAFLESLGALADDGRCRLLAAIARDRANRSLHSFFSPQGSFYTNIASGSLAGEMTCGLTAAALACRARGYESAAFAPVCDEDTCRGVIVAADRRQYRFPLRIVETIEMVAHRLGLAMQRMLLRQKLKDSLDSFEALSGHLLTIQEEEQRRIAMELHDGCGQDLILLKLRLQAMRGLPPEGGAELPGALDQLVAHCDKIIGDLREIAYGLQPADLRVLGLDGATRQLVREFSSATGIVVEAHVDLLARIADPKIQIGLFRIFQEVLSNVGKHARATWVHFDVRRQSETIEICLQDNGTGFQQQPSTAPANKRAGMGLPAMALRCRMIGATLSIDSHPGDGTRIVIRLACAKESNSP